MYRSVIICLSLRSNTWIMQTDRPNDQLHPTTDAVYMCYKSKPDQPYELRAH